MKKKICDFCGGELVKTQDLVVVQGKSTPINVQECKECGETFSSLKEAERVRKEINPSLWIKIKNIFSFPISEWNFFKGKVL